MVGLCFFIALPLAQADVIKLQATADIWLSAFNERERNSSSGKVERFKLKSIQEMAAIRFDPRPIMGREVLSARLFLHTTQPDNQLRYIRISTVNQDWVEGNSRRFYGTGNGATYNYADHADRKPWAMPTRSKGNIYAPSKISPISFDGSLSTFKQRTTFVVTAL
ncbi:MAG: hypothetical protein K8R11_11500 [Methanococcoides sp.]|nr:hypothetical protein [Methanococcoides sp.]